MPARQCVSTQMNHGATHVLTGGGGGRTSAAISAFNSLICLSAPSAAAAAASTLASSSARSLVTGWSKTDGLENVSYPVAH
jgi:hypothetical protein